jgi:hypothetical protein
MTEDKKVSRKCQDNWHLTFKAQTPNPTHRVQKKRQDYQTFIT